MKLHLLNALLIASLGAGCSARAAEKITISADDPLLDEAELDDSGAWSSAPFTRSVWLPYPAGSQVEIDHPLGREPTSIEVYISADQDERAQDKNPRVAFIASGDIATIVGVTDTSVSLNNNTRGDFFIRVVLR